jgi:hypothetical protein
MTLNLLHLRLLVELSIFLFRIILEGPLVLKNFADVAPLAPFATDVIMIHDRARATPAKLRAAMTLLQPMMSSTAMRGLVINRAE